MSALLSGNVVLITLVALAGAVAFATIRRSGKSRTTQLRGPPRHSFLWGQGRLLRASKDAAAVMEGWSATYGSAFHRPGPLGGSSVVITDPKAIAHFFSNMETTYHLGPLFRAGIERLVGRGVLWADGESHKRQRKAISPSFSNVKIREYTPIFSDAAYKLIHKWDSLFSHQLETEGSFVADVQHWLNAISLDSIGIAGFSHDFGALAGKRDDVFIAFEELSKGKLDPIDAILIILGPTFPFLNRIPTARRRALERLNVACGNLARNLLAQTRIEKEAEKGDRSIMGLLIKAEASTTGLTMQEEEVIAQMKTLMVAGYETTSSSMTWTLIELCKHPQIQAELRDELIKAFPSSDPSYEDLVSPTTLPLLDAVVHETLRLHPALSDTPRKAIHDDVIPLSTPVTLPNGTSTDRVFIERGQTVMVPLAAVNRSRAFWGEDSKEFRPQRWIDGVSGKAQELLAYRHILTFIDGPKTCLGKNFAVLEMKAVLGVLLRQYSFDLLDGPETKIGKASAIILRPKVEGEPGTRVPMRIRRVE